MVGIRKAMELAVRHNELYGLTRSGPALQADVSDDLPELR
jgi:hypothetical protein